mgnify:CR=1 FL=1
MAGKTTRKNKGPIGRKQHRTLRNKRQMRGGINSNYETELQNWKKKKLLLDWTNKHPNAVGWVAKKSGAQTQARLDTLEHNVTSLTEVLKKMSDTVIVINKVLHIIPADELTIPHDRRYIAIPTKIENLQNEIAKLQKKIDYINNEEPA